MSSYIWDTNNFTTCFAYFALFLIYTTNIAIFSEKFKILHLIFILATKKGP